MEYTYNDDRRDRRRRELRKKRMRQRMMVMAGLGLAAGLIAGVVLGSSGKKDLKAEVKTWKEKYETQSQEVSTMQGEVETLKEQVTEEGSLPDTVVLPWNLTLVNKWNEMAEGYEPDLVEVEDGQSVDSRIAEELKQMMADARAQGLSPFICSAYRSVNRQEELFNSGMKQRLNAGLGYFDAYQKTGESIAVPGTSEHALGLAVDIVANSYTTLDEGQEDTEEFKWLSANCHKYGFILRYPNGTTDITGIIYEPWHYRYVGVEVATEIANLGVTFEEYLEEYYEK